MLNRIINLKEYVPRYIMNYTEFQKIMEAEDLELQLIESTHTQVIDNRYITTCDLDGVQRFENILGVVPLVNDTIENRRFRVLSKWNSSIPYNYQYLDGKLKTLCGEGYIIILDFATQTLIVKLELENTNNFNSVKEIIDQVVPCNLRTIVMLMFNTYQLISGFTHQELSNYTHQYLKEGEM